MHNELNLIILNIIIIWGLIFLIGYISGIDTRRKSKFRNEMLKKASKMVDNGEFEYIYNDLVNNECFYEVIDEQKQNRKMIIFGYSLFILGLLGVMIVFTLSMLLEKEYTFIFPFAMISFVLGIILAGKKNKNTKYKHFVIKKIIQYIEPNIRYTQDEYISSRIVDELYFSAGFKDSYINRKYVTDYMEYEIDNNVKVRLADLHLQYHSSGKNRSTTDIFEGIAVKVVRENFSDSEILIERNKILKKRNRVDGMNEGFEKYFDLYTTNPNNVDFIVSQNVKNEIVSLYEKYGIMFEISIKENNLFIRFFTGEMFENKPSIMSIINKEKLYREYVILKSIMTLIKSINGLL